jgi:ligand-binding sensor domain-containing protein
MRLSLLILFVSHAVFAQYNHFYHIGDQEGLEQNTVSSILKTTDGYFWFATHGGLAKWDGTKSTIYTYNVNDSNSIGQGRVNALFEDANGVLWVGTSQGGLAKYIPSLDIFRRFTPSELIIDKSDGENVLAISELYGNLILGTHGEGILRFNKEQNRFNKIVLFDSQDRDIENLQVNKLVFDSDSNLLLATNKGMYLIPENTLRKGNSNFPAEQVTSSEVLDIFIDSKSNIWVGTFNEGVLVLNKSFKTV